MFYNKNSSLKEINANLYYLHNSTFWAKSAMSLLKHNISLNISKFMASIKTYVLFVNNCDKSVAQKCFEAYTGHMWHYIILKSVPGFGGLRRRFRWRRGERDKRHQWGKWAEWGTGRETTQTRVVSCLNCPLKMSPGERMNEVPSFKEYIPLSRSPVRKGIRILSSSN